MPDYGHPLRFGTFLTPTAQSPETPVALARLSEQLGFDLVTFQDHPYQPAFLDTWTLLSWVAAETSTVQLAANVHNLPLRPPAVLARSAASLDLLSRGRVALGIGSGAFWDAIEAMGGRRLTAGQAVQALEEALQIIRGIWDAGERSPLRVDGEHHRVAGAKRGPAPAHEIPVWIGAYKPRMLRLVGRAGDGWLPSLGYLQDGDLARGNAAIDEAALAAGRDPREIRRLLNVGGRFQAERAGVLQGPPASWVDDLVPFALEEGVGTFILASDDPGTLETFATEVVPALREAVDARRASTGGVATDRVRSAAAIAKRRDGIDYEGIPASLAASAVEPGDAEFRRVRDTYLRGGDPGLVLRPGTPAEVAEALAFARAQEVDARVPFGVRSGGHGVSGRSTNDGGVVIDVGRLDAIEVLDEEARLVRIGPGARWMEVAAALEPHGWALTSGDYGGVAVGGLATAGGLGWFAREHGLTIDHVRAVELVTASGELVRASSEEHPELFWGMRGAGANFGIVTAFEFEAHPVAPQVGFAQLAFDISDDPAGFLTRWAAAMEAAPRDVTTSLVLGGRAPGQPQVAQLLGVVDSDEEGTVLDRLRPFAELAPLVGQQLQLAPYSAVIAAFVQGGDHAGRGEPVSRSGLVERMTPEFAEAATRLLASGASHFFQLRAAGGAVAEVPAGATAYAGRTASVSVVAMGASDARLDAEWSRLLPMLSGSYLSFESSTDPARLERAWPGETLARLRALKREWDPEFAFRDNFPIDPAG